MELSAFTMKEKTRSKAKRNTLELFAVNSKQYKLILIHNIILILNMYNIMNIWSLGQTQQFFLLHITYLILTKGGNRDSL